MSSFWQNFRSSLEFSRRPSKIGRDSSVRAVRHGTDPPGQDRHLAASLARLIHLFPSFEPALEIRQCRETAGACSRLKQKEI
jgi:hypothetical protein